jgi:hypothetical protein
VATDEFPKQQWIKVIVAYLSDLFPSAEDLVDGGAPSHRLGKQ